MSGGHTDGPWQLDEYTGCVYGPGEDPDPIQTVGAGGPPEQQANARLIAAAPDLLEALSDCREALEGLQGDTLGRHPAHGYYYRDELLAKVRAAIATAKGEEVPS